MLRGAQELAPERETGHGGVVRCFRENATTFGVFDTFEDEDGRKAHLSGQIAAALGEAAQTTLRLPPVISPVDLLGAKVP